MIENVSSERETQMSNSNIDIIIYLRSLSPDVCPMRMNI